MFFHLLICCAHSSDQLRNHSSELLQLMRSFKQKNKKKVIEEILAARRKEFSIFD